MARTAMLRASRHGSAAVRPAKPPEDQHTSQHKQRCATVDWSGVHVHDIENVSPTLKAMPPYCAALLASCRCTCHAAFQARACPSQKVSAAASVLRITLIEHE